MSQRDRDYIKEDCHVCGDVVILIERDKLYCPKCYLKLKDKIMMTDMEKDIEERIKEWYQSIDDPFFQHKPWQHLFDEEKQMLAEMYWETKGIRQ